MIKRSDVLHDLAVENGKDYYVDPDTGNIVFTERYLQERGWCCASGCRHCPY